MKPKCPHCEPLAESYKATLKECVMLLEACKAAKKVIDKIPYEQKVAVPGISKILRAAIAQVEKNK